MQDTLRTKGTNCPRALPAKFQFEIHLSYRATMQDALRAKVTNCPRALPARFQFKAPYMKYSHPGHTLKEIFYLLFPQQMVE